MTGAGGRGEPGGAVVAHCRRPLRGPAGPSLINRNNNKNIVVVVVVVVVVIII